MCFWEKQPCTYASPQIAAIYAPNVTDGVASFELTPPTEREMAGRILRTLVELPWLVGEEQGTVCGYAYASRHQERPAYQWSANVSVYVHPGNRRMPGGQRALS
ncbi:MAG TPA: hypothetical protein VGO35_08775 [Gammaproteobacteria bacterium]|nr:hypothetical protein [Gammaproteobacteria bacterium]